MNLRFRKNKTQPECTNSLHILNRDGDAPPVMWNPTDKISTAHAKAVFDDLVSKGYLTYRADEDSEVIKTFDPTAKRIVASPQLVGG